MNKMMVIVLMCAAMGSGAVNARDTEPGGYSQPRTSIGDDIGSYINEKAGEVRKELTAPARGEVSEPQRVSGTGVRG